MRIIQNIKNKIKPGFYGLFLKLHAYVTYGNASNENAKNNKYVFGYRTLKFTKNTNMRIIQNIKNKTKPGFYGFFYNLYVLVTYENDQNQNPKNN